MYSYLLNIGVIGVATLLFSMWLGVKGDLVNAEKATSDLRAHYTAVDSQRIELQTALQTTAIAYSEVITKNEEVASATITDYSAANKRLSVKLSTVRDTNCAGDSSGGPTTDERVELHRETSEALVRITLDADAHVKALQDTIKQLTRKTNSKL